MPVEFPGKQRQSKSKTSRRKEMTKVRVEISEAET